MLVQRKLQRNHAKGVRGCFFDESDAFAEENNAPPPWNPHTPLGAKLACSICQDFTGRAKLLRLPDRGCWPRSEQSAVLFRRTGKIKKAPQPDTSIILNNMVKHPLSRTSLPFMLRLAVAQTALPSATMPTKVSFAADPTPSKRYRALSAEGGG